MESSQSKMELVVSIETPTTWFTEIRLRFRKGRTVIKMRMEHCLARKGLIGRVGGPEHRINIIVRNSISTKINTKVNNRSIKF